MAALQEHDLAEHNKTLFCSVDLLLSDKKTLLTTQHSLPEPILVKLLSSFCILWVPIPNSLSAFLSSTPTPLNSHLCLLIHSPIHTLHRNGLHSS